MLDLSLRSRATATYGYDYGGDEVDKGSEHSGEYLVVQGCQPEDVRCGRIGRINNSVAEAEKGSQHAAGHYSEKEIAPQDDGRVVSNDHHARRATGFSPFVGVSRFSGVYENK